MRVRPVLLRSLLIIAAACTLIACGGDATSGGTAVAPPLAITTTALPDGAVGGPYSQAILASGGSAASYTWRVIAGSLPAGLTLASSGTPSTALSGTPTAPGTSNFTIEVRDWLGATATQPLSLTITTALTISTAVLPDPTLGAVYSEAIAAAGGSASGYTWSVIAGSVPAGLTLAASGTPSTTLSGTPTTPGAASFTVEVQDSLGATATRAFAVTVTMATLSIDSPSELEGNTGTTPLTFTVTLSTALPSSVSVDYATSDGTATAPADYAAVTGTLNFAPGVTTQTIPVAIVGEVLPEVNETFSVTLSNPVGAGIGAGIGTGTIRDDDGSHGDFNGDGIPDLIVGAPTADTGGLSNNGEAYLFFGSASPSGTVSASAADVTFTGVASSDHLGTAVALGDLNDDGFADAIVGASWVPGGGSAGAVYVFFGSASPPATLGAASADFTLDNPGTGDQTGDAVAAGDLNGDGIDDLVVGTPNGGVTVAGEVAVVYGSPSLSGTMPLTGADVTLAGSIAGDRFGASVALGDVNADGIDDLFVGARDADSKQGAAYLFYGSTTLAPLLSAGSANVTIAGSNVTVPGLGLPVGVQGLGIDLTLGDVNNDGFDDLIAGATAISSNPKATPLNPGVVYVFWGSAALSGSMLSNTADVILLGAAANSQFGTSVACADVNRDGFDDIVAGSIFAAVGGAEAGAAYVFFGSATLSGTLDVSVADVTTNGASAGDRLGAAVTVGDPNNDGFADVVAGAPQIDTAYLFLGQATPPASRPPSTADQTLTGIAAGDQFAASLAGGR